MWVFPERIARKCEVWSASVKPAYMHYMSMCNIHNEKIKKYYSKLGGIYGGFPLR